MDDFEAFGSLATRIGFQLRRIDVAWRDSLTEQLSAHGLTPSRGTALIYVSLHEGCDQMALGQALGINRASTMKVVNELVALGAVERRTGQDRRTNALHLTARGASLCVAVEQVTESHDHAVLDVLTEAERQEFYRMLLKLRGETLAEKATTNLRRIK